ncbi:hypothetical protein LAZ40_09560 [Cereibacter sphaeroides]|uniref:hypothetical protein n=1 Tax=Cereibacter sphaeroides TaxID=1063 RepID=UPI001F247518|nr:hypothetical protein [Cereibacter sphaeroides]MCE6959298.1 hypothetical protein [Cereibacter sphaeroides]MCE6972890.1 hypothetical protein [Cereibacter sphaeroides]
MPYLLLGAITAVTLLGDACLKMAALRGQGLFSAWFVAGVLLYAMPAAGWVLLMREFPLATIGVLYSASTLLLLALLGVFVFGEGFGWREAAGVVLAIAAIVVMNPR